MALSKHMPALDALRGVAIALVIASHAFPMSTELPWTVKRFSNLGFFGVQLFFVVSCFTLANSWRRTEAAGGVSLRDFALRRVFRIAPAYFLAAVFFAWLIPPPGIGVIRLLTFVTFTSGWTPAQMPTVPNVWIGVPGGWSVAAEFSFYAVFPVVMRLLRGLPRAVAGLVVSLPLAWLANTAAFAGYVPAYGWTATDQFAYYWLPNELPVFLCGLVAFEAVTACDLAGRAASAGRRIAASGPALLAASVAVFLALAIVPWPRLPDPGHAFLPNVVIAGAAFAVATVVLILRPLAVIVNRPLIRLGQVSFSAYLIHFAVIAGLDHVLPRAVFTQTGVPAIGVSCALFLLILLTTGLLSGVTYRLIEVPGIRVGSRLIRQTTRRPAPTG